MTLAVFFPSLMGIGILASGLLLISDLIRSWLPNRGYRRGRRVAIGSYGVVAAAATAAGQMVRQVDVLARKPRRRATYVTMGLLALGAAMTTIVLCTSIYNDPVSLLYRSIWMPGFAIAGGLLFGGFALLFLIVAWWAPRLPVPVSRLVRSTILGRLDGEDSLVVVAEPHRKEPL